MTFGTELSRELSKKISKEVIREVRVIVDDAVGELATMTKRGFDDINERMVTKVEFNEFKAEMHEFKTSIEPALYDLQTDMSEVKTKLNTIDTRLTRVEGNLESLTVVARSNWQDHEKRIVRLEEKVP